MLFQILISWHSVLQRQASGSLLNQFLSIFLWIDSSAPCFTNEEPRHSITFEGWLDYSLGTRAPFISFIMSKVSCFPGRLLQGLLGHFEFEFQTFWPMKLWDGVFPCVILLELCGASDCTVHLFWPRILFRYNDHEVVKVDDMLLGKNDLWWTLGHVLFSKLHLLWQLVWRDNWSCAELVVICDHFRRT